jgi:hypothetical protein
MCPEGPSLISVSARFRADLTRFRARSLIMLAAERLTWERRPRTPRGGTEGIRRAA